MRICLVTSSLKLGGAEKVAASLANFWQEAGHQVTVINFGKPDSFFKLNSQITHLALGFELAKLKGFSKLTGLFALTSELKRKLNDQDYDLVISFMDQVNILTVYALSTSKTPIIVTEHTYPARSSLLENSRVGFFWKYVRNTFYSKASLITVLNQASKEYFPKSLQSKIKIVPNPVVLQEEDGNKTDVVQSPAIVSLGRLEKVKRFDLLIRAFAQLAPEFPEWKLYIYGEGKKRAELEGLVAEFDLKHKIYLPGVSSNPAKVLEQAEIFCLSSECEGFGLALVEALSLGVAAVATDCWKGDQEIVKDRENALVVPVNDLQELQRALRELMSDSILRESLGAQGRVSVKGFELGEVGKLWNEIFVYISK